MAKKEKKVLGLLPRGITTTLILGLVAVVVLALIWSYVMMLDFSADNAWVLIVEWILLAVLIGLVVGILANDEKPVTLWIAAGLTVVGVALTGSLMYFVEQGMDVSLDKTLLSALGDEAFGLSVSIGAIVLGVIAALCAAIASRTKDILNK